MIKRLRHTAKVGALMTVAATGLLIGGATPALADTSQATANAAVLELLGNPLITTGTCAVEHESNQSLPDEICNENPGLTGGVLSAGLLSQTAIARAGEAPDGSPATSAACAGVVGGNGTIQIGPGDDCQFTSGDPDGVVLDLGGVAQIRADAIIAECNATSVPQGGTATVTFVNASVQLLALGLPVGPAIPLASNPAPNTPVLGLGPLLSITLNQQPPDPAPAVGGVGTTALDVTVLGLLGQDPLIHLALGTVTCGPNVVAADVPVIPLEGLPIALATVAGVGVIALVVHRRRRLATETQI
ncbi:MAG: hypothetical protein H0T70_05510 [Acidimicrobiia bacterium]|nr:hypothetical protein [Acidimicrobiia bacterium]